MAYEGLAGHRPFTGTTPVDIAAAHVNNPAPPLPDSVDVQLREICHVNAGQGPVGSPEDALVVSPYAGTHRTPPLLDQQTRSNRHRHGHVRQSTAAPEVTSTPRIVLEARPQDWEE